MDPAQGLTHRQELVKVRGNLVLENVEEASAHPLVLPDCQMIVVRIVVAVEVDGEYKKVRHLVLLMFRVAGSS